MSKYGLGRLISKDKRDRAFLMSPPLKVTRNKMIWETPTALNQGQTYECTAYSAEHLLLSGPVKNKMYKTPHDMYLENQSNDQWYPNPHQGSSVRAAMKVLQNAGYLDNYLWAFDADTIRRWLLMNGPVVLGIDWYTGMENPDSKGFIRLKGDVIGGHAIMAYAADDTLTCPDRSKGAVGLLQSWGTTWGKQGKCWLSYKELDKLIKADGEAATPSEITGKSK